ncbi:hypothetical protein E4U30_001004 [Claviceps sp. LM220 group G6]|nr:hypothetical protein E4U30_001004 [Claviceps sp. LM220 group G6]
MSEPMEPATKFILSNCIDTTPTSVAATQPHPARPLDKPHLFFRLSNVRPSRLWILDDKEKRLRHLHSPFGFNCRFYTIPKSWQPPADSGRQNEIVSAYGLYRA